MNKAELIEQIASSADLSKLAATRALNTVLETISATLARGEEVSLAGFGNFLVKDAAARVAQNPRTGEKVSVPAKRTPKFRPAKALKDAVLLP